jgi:hypothetical protein
LSQQAEFINMPPALSRATRASIFEAANTSPHLQQLIAASLDDYLVTEIRSITGAIDCTGALLIREVFTCLHNGRSSASEGLRSSLDKRKAHQSRIRSVHRDVVRELGLNWSPAKVEQWNSSLPTIRLSRLKYAYPQPGKFVCEDEGIKRLWEYRLMEAKQADKRLKRCEPVVISPDKLIHTVAPTEDLVVRDSKSGEIVLMVVRHFSRSIDTIDWMENIVVEAAEICRNIRVSLLVLSRSLRNTNKPTEGRSWPP